jgi:hypothetical protein
LSAVLARFSALAALQAGGHRFDPGTLHLDFAGICARHRSSTPAPSASVEARWQQTAALLARGLELGSGLNVGLGGGAEPVLEHPVVRLVALRLTERTYVVAGPGSSSDQTAKRLR